MAKSSSALQKIIAIVSFVFISLALYSILKTPATGYEISIYSNTPLLVWIFLIGSTIGGIWIIVCKAFNNEGGNWWLLGFLILIIINFIILSMHAMRGYYLYAGQDHLLHLNWISDLIRNGYLNFGYETKRNFYPILHIFCAQISEICDISPEVVGKYLPPFFSVLFLMLFMYMLAKSSVAEKGQLLLSCAASCMLFFNSLHLMLYPHTFSVLLFVLIIYLYFQNIRKHTWEYKFLFIVLLILLPYSHPASSLVILFLIMTMELCFFVYTNRYDPKSKITFSFIPITISSMTFFMWITSFAMFGYKLRTLQISLFEPYESRHFVTLMDAAARIELGELIEYNFKMYGDNVICISLAFIAGLIILKRVFKKDNRIKYLFLLFVFFLACLPLEYSFFIVTETQTPGRLLNLLNFMTVAPVLVGFVLFELFKNKKKRIAITFVMIILSFTFLVSLFSVYHSPWTFTSAEYITEMDVTGTTWFSGHKDYLLKFDYMGGGAGTIIIPEHFNYPYNHSLGDWAAHYYQKYPHAFYKPNIYILINERCIISNSIPIIAKVKLNRASGWGFVAEDFEKLGNDPTAGRLYSNGEFNTYLVYST